MKSPIYSNCSSGTWGLKPENDTFPCLASWLLRILGAVDWAFIFPWMVKAGKYLVLFSIPHYSSPVAHCKRKWKPQHGTYMRFFAPPLSASPERTVPISRTCFSSIISGLTEAAGLGSLCAGKLSLVTAPSRLIPLFGFLDFWFLWLCDSATLPVCLDFDSACACLDSDVCICESDRDCLNACPPAPK